MQTELILARSRIVRLVRRFFDEQEFIELQTPRLVGLPGQEPYLDPMWTEVHEMKQSTRVSHAAALITSPEYAMKKMLSAGFEKIYDLGPCFRDSEPWDGTHDPEFLLLEWYRRNAGLEALMHDTEKMMRFVAKEAATFSHAHFSEEPFRRLTVAHAMKEYAQIDLDALLDDRDAMARVIAEHGQTVHATDTWDDLFFKVFLSEVEPHLGWNADHSAWRPTFLWNYPASMAALARRNPDDTRYALRTELYVGDYELANGFAELSDPVEQRTRFEEERALRQTLGKRVWPIDDAFIEALPGMGDAAGIAFGVDRLAMLLTGATSISDLMPVPVRQRFVG